MGYDRWATCTTSNKCRLPLPLYQQYGFSSPEELDAAFPQPIPPCRKALQAESRLEAAIREKKELQRNLLPISKTRPARDGLKAQKTEKARSSLPGTARKRFYHSGRSRPLFPGAWHFQAASYKALQAEIESLIREKRRLQRLPGETPANTAGASDRQGQYRPDFTGSASQ